MSLKVTDLQWADFEVWTPHELFVERIERNNDLLLTMQPKLRSFYMDHLLPALVASMQPAAPRVREIQSDVMRCTYLPYQYCQSTIGGRNGSSACTVIAAEVVHSVLAGVLEQVDPSRHVPNGVISSYIDSMRSGNRTYGNANLGGELLGVYDALDLLAHTHLTAAPRGDIGCHTAKDLASELERLTDQAEEVDKHLAGLLVQTPLTVAISIAPSRIITVFDSHCHHSDGALIACAHSSTRDDSEKIAGFISALVGPISDCHLCLLLLKTFR